MADGPEVTDALRDVLAGKGWTLTSDGSFGSVYSAELVGPTIDPQVSSATAGGLVAAVDSWHERLARTKPGHLNGAPKTIITGPLDMGDVT
jgi:hypothetical protein